MSEENTQNNYLETQDAAKNSPITASPLHPITVLIADDHPIFRRGLREIIETDEELKIIDEANDGEEAIRKICEAEPQVAVLDVDMPKRDGLEVLKFIREKKLHVNVVFLTMYKEEDFFNAALDAGVKGYVIKDSAIGEITEAIRAAAHGKNFISPILSTLLMNRLNHAENLRKSPLESLTDSERRILKFVSEMKSNKQIADELCISVRTVEHHRSNIYAKLELEGKNALLAFALTHKSKLQ